MMMLIPNKPANSYFTDEQWQAIHQKNSNVLISAGAGSGKTSVLTERVLRILKEGIDINRLLILTFTKAAALEMKERIRKNLEKAVNSENNPHLIKQLELLEVSFITTFDSFALYLVKKYNHHLGIKKEIQIGDDNLFKQQKMRIINELFQKLYEENNPDFYNYLKTYTRKSDDKLEDQVLFLADQLLKYDLNESFLETYEENYFNDAYENRIKSELSRKLDEIKLDIKLLNQQLSFLSLESEGGISSKEALHQLFSDLLSSKDIDHFQSLFEFSSFKVKNKTSKDDRAMLKEITEPYKKIIEQATIYFTNTLEDHIRIHDLSKPHQLFLLNLSFRFLNEFWAFQHQLGIYDFLSISSLSTKLLKEHEDVRNELKCFYHEILIDEFQDTSLIQNIFVNQIENNNVFMVGDIKQSIYRFRDAKPELFQKRYDLYQANPSEGVKIDLNKNFRSRKEILEDINKLFVRTMSPSYGGVTYDGLQQLVFGNMNYEKNKAVQPYGIEILDVIDDETLEQEGLGFTDDEKEVFSVIKDIKEKIDSNYQILDSKTNQLRDARYDDFVILIDRKSPFRLFKQIAEANQIPLFIHATEPFLTNDDVLALRSLLSLFYCFKDFEYGKVHFYHDFFSVFRSYLFQINDQILHDTYLSLKDDLYFNYQKHVKNEVILDALNKLNQLRETKERLPLDLFLLEMISEFDILEKGLSLNQIKQIESRLFYLVDKAKSLSKLGFGLKELLEYFEFIKEAGLDLDFDSSSKLKEGMVNVMTIHKSKGLEFQIVYFPMLSKRWNNPNLSNFYFDLTYGMIMPSFDEGLTDNIEKALHLDHEKREMISERLRLFYVALTRAKELAIIVLNETSSEKFVDELVSNELVSDSIRKDYNSYNHLIYSVIGSFSNKRRKAPFDAPVYNSSYQEKTPKSLVSKEKKDTFKYVNFSYKPKELVKSRFSKSSFTVKDKATLNELSLGTELHGYLESLDFKKPLEPQISSLDIDDYRKKLLLKINNFHILDDLSQSEVMTEYEFMYEADGKTYHGIIDLLIEKENEVLLIDYKLKDITDPSYQKQLKGYITYLMTKTDKEINAYLYSIMLGTYIKI